MIPYKGRLILRATRLLLALASWGTLALSDQAHAPWLNIALAMYGAFAALALSDVGGNSVTRGAAEIVVDAANFGIWAWIAHSGWQPVAMGAYLFATTIVLHELIHTIASVVTCLVIVLVLTPSAANALLWTVAAQGLLAIAAALGKEQLEDRWSAALQHNVILRGQAASIREQERQRMAADLHDGPLQIFIGFQMRMELIRKLMVKDMNAANDEIRQLKEICSNQVTEMRHFVRSMRPADEGMSLGASLSRMAEMFQKDTGVQVTFTAGELRDPAQTEVSLELLQLVREAFNNIQKHSGATRVAMTAARRDNRLEITVEDNGAGFPFAGNFSLDELDALRIGPVSIKRRIRTVNGDLSLDSEPGHGAKLEMRIPM